MAFASGFCEANWLRRSGNQWMKGENTVCSLYNDHAFFPATLSLQCKSCFGTTHSGCFHYTYTPSYDIWLHFQNYHLCSRAKPILAITGTFCTRGLEQTFPQLVHIFQRQSWLRTTSHAKRLVDVHVAHLPTCLQARVDSIATTYGNMPKVNFFNKQLQSCLLVVSGWKYPSHTKKMKIWV